MTTIELEAEMMQVHIILTAVVANAVTEGVDEKTAFGSHLRWLLERTPKVAAAYTRWLERRSALEAAREEVVRARLAYSVAATRRDRRFAAEDIEFWTSKVAFLSHVK